MMKAQNTLCRNFSLSDRAAFVRILLFTTLLNNTLAFTGVRQLRATQRIDVNGARRIRQTPAYQRRRESHQYNPLKTSPLCTADGPFSELNDVPPVSWDEAIAADSIKLEDTGSISTKDKAILIASVIFGLGVFSALLTVASIGSWRYFAAGGVCAAFSHAIPTPVDVVKVRYSSTTHPLWLVLVALTYVSCLLFRHESRLIQTLLMNTF